MKETVKTSRTAGYLEKIFRALNVKYFNGELEEPIITIQSTPRAYGPRHGREETQPAMSLTSALGRLHGP